MHGANLRADYKVSTYSRALFLTGGILVTAQARGRVVYFRPTAKHRHVFFPATGAMETKSKRTKKANFSDKENICLLEEVQKNYGLITQSEKVAHVALKKREAWRQITNKVNAIGSQGRSVDAIKKRWKDMRDAVKNKQKTAFRTGGGPPDAPVPYEDFILDILGDNTNLIDGIYGRKYKTV